MRVDDLLCETFELDRCRRSVVQPPWHRCVIAVGTDYVDIADTTNVDDYASGSDVPRWVTRLRSWVTSLIKIDRVLSYNQQQVGVRL